MAAVRFRGYTAEVRPLPLALILSSAASWASAQTKLGAVEPVLKVETPVGAPGLSTLGGAALVPSLSAPTLTAASFAAPPPLLAPSLVTPARFQAPAALSPAKPAAFAPAAEDKTVPKALAPIRKALLEAAPDGISKLGDEQLLDLTKKLAGEDAGDGADAALPEKFDLRYLRYDKPLPFGKDERAAYKDALSYGTGNDWRTAAVVDATAKLLESAGVAYTLRARQEDGKTQTGFLITPQKEGSGLNRIAWELERKHGTKVEYAPARLGYSAVASYNHELNTLFLPHFGRDAAYEAILHESHHSNYAARQERGDLSPFHARALARGGGAIVPRALHYANYASMEELTAHAKTVKQLLARGRREKPESFWPVYAIDTEAEKLEDLTRSANFLSARILTELKAGTKVEPLPPGHWAIPQLGPVAGGSWYRIALPWSDFYIPVLDEPAPPAKTGLARWLSKTPPTTGEKAAKRTADALQLWAKEAGPLVRELRGALLADELDWEKVNALADRLVALGPKAEKAFKTAK